MMQDLPIPAVVKWFRVYSAILAVIYGVLFLACAVGMFFALRAPAGFWQEIDTPAFFAYGYLVFLLLMSLVLGGVFVGSFFFPRKPWAWTFDFVLICMGFTSACFIPFSVPLLVFWLRDEAKVYFNKA